MYYFIVNPHSRSGKALSLWQELEQKMKAQKIPYEAHLTEYAGHAITLASQLTGPSHPDQSPKVLIALGGDGTLNEVLNGLQFSSPVTLGYIPTGSGNDFARSLKLPRDPNEALKHILSPKYFRYLDYGILTYGDQEPKRRRFGVSCGLGYDAGVCHGLLTGKAKAFFNAIHLGKLSYLYVGICQLFTTPLCNGKLVLDDTRTVHMKKIAFVSFHNLPYEGGGFCFAPDAVPTDGQLEVCTISGRSRLGLIPILLMALLGGHHKNMKGVRIYRCKEAVLTVDKTSHLHTDGEIHPDQSKISISCMEKKVRVIV